MNLLYSSSLEDQKLLYKKSHGNKGHKHTLEAIEKSRKSRTGLKRTQEIIEKLKVSHIGRIKSSEEIEKIRIGNLGKKQSSEAIEKIRQSKLGNKYNLGKKQTSEHRENSRQAQQKRFKDPNEGEKIRQGSLGKKQSSTHCKNISIGKLHIFSVLDHLCKDKYCILFNNKLREEVRIRDSHTCQLCGKVQNGRKLSVHHIHYDKQNCEPDLICLCVGCNTIVNYNKNKWESLFMNKLNDRRLLFWTKRKKG